MKEAEQTGEFGYAQYISHSVRGRYAQILLAVRSDDVKFERFKRAVEGFGG